MSASKIIIVLAIQSVLLLFLSYKVILLETQTAELASVQQNRKPVPTPVVQSTGYQTPAVDIVSREETRQIIQEEMDVLGERLLEAITKFNVRTVSSAPKSQIRMNERQIAQLNGSIKNQIDAFASQGVASQAEIAKLEQMIARLPANERLQALGELNKAVNSGRFDVKF